MTCVTPWHWTATIVCPLRLPLTKSYRLKSVTNTYINLKPGVATNKYEKQVEYKTRMCDRLRWRCYQQAMVLKIELCVNTMRNWIGIRLCFQDLIYFQNNFFQSCTLSLNMFKLQFKRKHFIVAKTFFQPEKFNPFGKTKASST